MDVSIRARQMSKRGGDALQRCTFMLTELGEDVLGQRRSEREAGMQKLLTWCLQVEAVGDKGADPVFAAKEDGEIAETDKFDVVSIQFVIHYMMLSR